MFLAGGKYWESFYPAIRDELITRQKREDGHWEGDFNDEYATSMALIVCKCPTAICPSTPERGREVESDLYELRRLPPSPCTQGEGRGEGDSAVERLSCSKSPACALLALLLFCPLAARAQDEWRLTTADFQSSTIGLQRLDETGVHGITSTGEDRTVALDQLLEISRDLPPRAAAGPFVLFLQGGDRIGGEPGAMTGQQIQWHSPTLGDIHLSLRDLVAIGALGAVRPEARSTDDAVTLANNDQVHGIITAIAGAKVSVQTANGNTDIPLASVKLISFAAAADRRPPRRTFRVRLDDGTSVAADTVALDANALHFTIPGNVPQSIDLSRVCAIEQINGPVSWLSVRPPSENVYVPFISPGQSWPAQMDRSVVGDVLRFRDTTFSHGIGVHAYSKLSWPIDGTWTAFRTQYAIDGDNADSLAADVTIRIRLDGKVVYEQPHVHGGVLSPIIVQQLEGAKSLTLEADFGDRMDTRARLNWIEPALLKNPQTPVVGPASPSTAPATRAARDGSE